MFDPASLGWLPRGSAPRLPDDLRKVGDFARPEFEALYKSERLEWVPGDRYVGRALSRCAYDYSVLVQLVSAPAYNPQTLEWLARATYPQIPVERRILGDFQQPAFQALFKPEQLQWFPSDRYAGRSAARSLNDWSVLVQLVTAPAFDPKNLEWQPRDSYFGRVGKVVAPAFQVQPILPPVEVVPPPPAELGGGAGGGSKLPGQEAPQDEATSPWKPPQWLLDKLDREEEERIRAEVQRRQGLLKGEAPSTAEPQIIAEGLVAPRLWEGAETLSADVIEKLQQRQPVKVPAIVDDDEEAILILLMDL